MILVTGAGGLLGANLVFDLNSLGFRVVAVGRNWLPELRALPVERCDLTVAQRIEELFIKWRPDCVVHCAALTDVDYCEANPPYALLVNAEMPRILAETASRYKSRFVYISTDSVFDGQRGAYTEEDDVAPVNMYARSKLAGEIAVQRVLPDALIVRTNIYGWNMQPKASLAEWVLGRLESDSEVPGFEDVVFSPILVNDLGDVIVQMLERKLKGVFHVAGSEPCSKYEFALRLADSFGLNRALVRRASIEQATLRAPRPRNTSLNTTLISRALDWSAPGLDAGLQRLRTLRNTGYQAHLKQAGREHGNACYANR